MPTTGTTSTKYRVTSLSEAGNGFITVSFTEQRDNAADQNNGGTPYGSFSKYMTAADADAYFPGQVYTMTLTLEA